MRAWPERNEERKNEFSFYTHTMFRFFFFILLRHQACVPVPFQNANFILHVRLVHINFLFVKDDLRILHLQATEK